jgi:hypothetical protein
MGNLAQMKIQGRRQEMAASGMTWPCYLGKDKEQGLKEKPVTTRKADKRNGGEIAIAKAAEVSKMALLGA